MTESGSGSGSGSGSDSIRALFNESAANVLRESHESSDVHKWYEVFESWEFIICVVITATVVLSVIIVIFCILTDKIVKYIQLRKTHAEIIAHFQKYNGKEVCHNCWCRPATVRCDSCRARYFCAGCSDAVHNPRRDKRCCSAWRRSLSKHTIVSIRKHKTELCNSTDAVCATSATTASSSAAASSASGAAPSNSGTPKKPRSRSVSRTKTPHIRSIQDDLFAAAAAGTDGDYGTGAGAGAVMAAGSLGTRGTGALDGFSAPNVSSSTPLAQQQNARMREEQFRGGRYGVNDGDEHITINNDGYEDEDDDDDDDSGGSDSSDDEIHGRDDGDTAPLLKSLNSSINSYTTFKTLIDADGYDSS